MRKLVMLGASAALAAAGLFAAPAQAGGDCGALVVGGPVYFASDTNSENLNLWIYVESNGQEGLQRGGTTMTLNERDTCQEGEANPDTAIL